MKNAWELSRCILGNREAMTEWYLREFRHAEKFLDRFIEEFGIAGKKYTEPVRGAAMCNFDESNATYYNLYRLLAKHGEPYSLETSTGAVDILFRQIANELTERMHTSYPCLAHNHIITIRANRRKESVIYIGPNEMGSNVGYYLFSDRGVFMTQGLDACCLFWKNSMLS